MPFREWIHSLLVAATSSFGLKPFLEGGGLQEWVAAPPAGLGATELVAEHLT